MTPETPCAWLAGSCRGEACLFWYSATSHLPTRNRMEGMASRHAAALLALATRPNAVADSAFRALLATSPAFLLRSLLDLLTLDQVAGLLLDWGRDASALPTLARLWHVVRKREEVSPILDLVQASSPATAQRLQEIGDRTFPDLAFLEQDALRQLVAKMPNRELLPLVQGSPLPIQRRLVEVLDDGRLSELANLPPATPLSPEEREELLLTLETGMAVLAAWGDLSVIPVHDEPAAPFCPLVRGPCRREDCLFWTSAWPGANEATRDPACLIDRVNRLLSAPDPEADPRGIPLIASWLMAGERRTAALLFSDLPDRTQEEAVFWLLTTLLADYRERDPARAGFHQNMLAEHLRTEEVRRQLLERLFDLVALLPRARRGAILATVARRDARARALVPPPGWSLFEDLAYIDDLELQRLVRELDSTTLLLAFKAGSWRVREKFFANLSERAEEMLREDLVLMGPVRVEEAEEAQRDILVKWMASRRQHV